MQGQNQYNINNRTQQSSRKRDLDEVLDEVRFEANIQLLLRERRSQLREMLPEMATRARNMEWIVNQWRIDSGSSSDEEVSEPNNYQWVVTKTSR